MLPQIQHILQDVEIPSQKKTIKIRQMLAKEEKILLMAKTGDSSDILNAIKQVINNCIITTNVDVDKFAIFDIQLIFVKLRAFSISKNAMVSFKDNDEMSEWEEASKKDPKLPQPIDYEHTIDLNSVTIKWPEGISKEITIPKTNIKIMMKYPEASLINNSEFLNSTGKDVLDLLIISGIDYIMDGDNKFTTDDKEETIKWLNDLPIETYRELRNYIGNLPTLYYEFSYKNKFDKERKIVLSSLSDFFQF